MASLIGMLGSRSVAKQTIGMTLAILGLIGLLTLVEFAYYLWVVI